MSFIRSRKTVVLILSERPQTAEATHAWLLRQLPPGPKPSIRRPLNYARIAVLGTLVLGSISTVTLAGPLVLPFVRNRNLWATISLIIILAFTSGHMFNHIRKVPYVTGDGHGGVSYFAGGFSNQFGIETQIIAAMCLVPLLCMVCSIGMLIVLRWCSCVFDDRAGPEGS